MEGKLERCGKDFTDSQAYVSQTHRNTFTDRNIRRNIDFKSHYLDTFEGLHLNACGQIEMSGKFP